MPTLPRTQSTLRIEEIGSDAVRLSLVHDGVRSEGVRADIEQLGRMAADLLSAARIIHSRSGEPLKPLQTDAAALPTVVPSALALAGSDIPHHSSLVLQFGDARIGVAAPNHTLAALRPALTSLSSSEPPAVAELVSSLAKAMGR